MNAADQAIEDIREVRRRISAEFDHDIAKYLAFLREQEEQDPEQVRRGRDLLAQREFERQKCANAEAEPLALRDKPEH